MNEVSFKIDERYLYTDEELIEFNIPIFFICQDKNNQKYAVLCVDSEQLIYIVGKVEIKEILLMLNSRITLREFFMNISEKWRILAGEDYMSDEVERIEELCEEELPVEGAYFELSNSKIENYKKRLNKEKGLKQYNAFCEKIYLQYIIPQREIVVHMKDNSLINPIMYISEHKELGYTTWHCQKDKVMDLQNDDNLMFVMNENAYSNKEVICYG